MSKHRAFLAVLAFTSAGILSAQTARLSGTVVDPTGAVVPNAVVDVLLPEKTILTSDASQGIFTYTTTSGAVQKVNILQATQQSIGRVVESGYVGGFEAVGAVSEYADANARRTLAGVGCGILDRI
jgi:hypothetical protein